MRVRVLFGVVVVLSTAGTTSTAATTSARAGANGTAASTRTVILGVGYEPRTFYPDPHTLASGFRWSVWSNTIAIGTGLTKRCLAPSLGATHCHTTRQTMVYTEPRRECGRITLTRLSYSKWTIQGELEHAGAECLWYAT